MRIVIAKDKEHLKQLIKGTIQKEGVNCNLNFIDVSNIKDMSYLFGGPRRVRSREHGINNFNGNISQWNVSNVTNMNNMFAESDFNGDISKWNVSNVINMSNMFRSSVFNGNISQWNVSNVTDMSEMFRNSKFNQDISKWNVSKVIDMSTMFARSEFNGNIENWDTSNIKKIGRMFLGSKFKGNIVKWNLSNVEDIPELASKRKPYNGILGLMQGIIAYYKIIGLMESEPNGLVKYQISSFIFSKFFLFFLFLSTITFLFLTHLFKTEISIITILMALSSIFIATMITKGVNHCYDCYDLFSIIKNIGPRTTYIFLVWYSNSYMEISHAIIWSTILCAIPFIIDSLESIQSIIKPYSSRLCPFSDPSETMKKIYKKYIDHYYDDKEPYAYIFDDRFRNAGIYRALCYLKLHEDSRNGYILGLTLWLAEILTVYMTNKEQMHIVAIIGPLTIIASCIVYELMQKIIVFLQMKLGKIIVIIGPMVGLLSALILFAIFSVEKIMQGFEIPITIILSFILWATIWCFGYKNNIKNMATYRLELLGKINYKPTLNISSKNDNCDNNLEDNLNNAVSDLIDDQMLDLVDDQMLDTNN